MSMDDFEEELDTVASEPALESTSDELSSEMEKTIPAFVKSDDEADDSLAFTLEEPITAETPVSNPKPDRAGPAIGAPPYSGGSPSPSVSSTNEKSEGTSYIMPLLLGALASVFVLLLVL